MDALSDDALLHTLQQFPDRCAALVERCADPRARAADGGFSLVEHLCHLRDLEREGYALRIRRILAEHLPELQEIDGNTLAIERGYLSQDPHAAWRDWREARWQTLALLREALPAHAQRKGIYGGFGVITLRELARGIAAHDAAHWAELQLPREPGSAA